MQPGQHRETARILLTKPNGEVFLLLTHFDPEVGLPPRWITPGGGIDEGETPIEAAIRKLGQITGRWDWGDGVNHHTYTDHFYRLEVEDFILDDSGWTEDERRDVLEYRWWSTDELFATGEQIAPHGLADLIRNHSQP
jgi:hypothetical protein